MTAITHEFLDRVAAQGHMDFMQDLAIPVHMVALGIRDRAVNRIDRQSPR